MISNKHKFRNWDTVFPLSYENLQIYDTFRLHPKFLPKQDLFLKLSHLKNIFQNKWHPVSRRQIVAVGETGLDKTSKYPLDYQKTVFEQQVLLARNINLPLVLHCRGLSLFRPMLHFLESILPKSHTIQWHSVKSDSDLHVIDQFLALFPNSVISINGASTHVKDIDLDKAYKKWLRNHATLLQHVVLETDCPWLCPENLPPQQYNPCTGIFIVSKCLENILRIPGKTASAIIRIANDNAKNIFRLSIEK